jgi:hypothetical protein
LIARPLFIAAFVIATGAASLLGACTPTVRIDVAPITIYAKLDADVRLKLDEDVKALIRKNPTLF